MTARAWVCVAWGVAGLMAAPSSRAWVDVCNSRGEPVTVAFALAPMDPPGVSTGGHMGAHVEGWWRVAPKECATVSDSGADGNWLYFHAKTRDGELRGSARLCVRSKAFKSRQLFLMSDETCKDGWREASFVRRQSSARNYRFTVN